MIIRTDAQWRELFQQHLASGLSSSQFCKQQKLCPKYFSLRKKQLGLQDNRPFVALQIEAPVLKPGEQSPALTLSLGKCSLKFSTLPSAEWLSDLLKAYA